MLNSSRIFVSIRNVQIHWLITLHASVVLDEAGTTTLNLNSTTGLVLNVLHVLTTLANNLSSKVKTRDWFEVNREALFRPFALF